MALSNAPKRSNVNENWLFEFTADNKNCIDFDGSNDTINFGNILSTPFENFTIEFWLKCNADEASSNDSGVVIQLSSGSGEDLDENVSFNVNLQNGGEVRLFYEYDSGSNEQNTTSSFDLSVGTWTHVAVVRDDSTGEAYFYKNGALVETESASNDPEGGTSSDANMTIGNSFANSNGFNGELAHVRVWDVARHADDISKYYNRLVDSSHTGLVGYWKLDEGTGTSVADSSSNSNAGTISGASWSINNFDQYIHAFGIAFRDTTVSSNFYPGSVIDNNIDIRDSIDLVNSTSKTSNINITSANFKQNGTEMYKLLFNGTNNYHNKEVRVFAQFDHEDTLSNCQQIFSGRLIELSLGQHGNVAMQINSHRPWANMEIPQEKSNKYNIHIPVVYGGFTPNDSNAGTPTLVGTKLYPAPVVSSSQNEITTLMPRAYADGSNSHANLWLGDDMFFPAAGQTSPYPVKDETEAQDDINVLITKHNKRYGGIARAKFSEPSTSLITFTDTYKAFDGDSATFATATTTGTGTDTGAVAIGFVGPPRTLFATILNKIIFDFKANATGNVAISLFFQSVDSNLTESFAVETYNVNSAGTVYTRTYDVSALSIPTDVNISLKFDYGAASKTISISDIRIESRILFFGGTNDDEDEQDSTEISKVKFLYSGGAGLAASWDSGAITHGHDAHRDLLQRFTGISSADPENWSDLNTDRAIDNWKIRFWQLKPAKIIDILNKLAYEFGFVAKFAPNGNVKYIYVKKSSELSASLNLTKNDINNITLTTTGVNNIVTKNEYFK